MEYRPSKKSLFSRREKERAALHRETKRAKLEGRRSNRSLLTRFPIANYASSTTNNKQHRCYAPLILVTSYLAHRLANTSLFICYAIVFLSLSRSLPLFLSVFFLLRFSLCSCVSVLCCEALEAHNVASVVDVEDAREDVLRVSTY